MLDLKTVPKVLQPTISAMKVQYGASKIFATGTKATICPKNDI